MKIFNSYKFWLICFAIIVAFLYALPNLYGYKPALEIDLSIDASIDQNQIRQLLKQQNLEVKLTEKNDQLWLVEFSDVNDQLNTRKLIDRQFNYKLHTNIKLEPQHPNWLNFVDALPMYLGLDLQGGVYFLMEVDMKKTIDDILVRYQNDFKQNLNKQNIKNETIYDTQNSQIIIELENSSNETINYLETNYPEFSFSSQPDSKQINVKISEQRISQITNLSIEQNMNTIRNRIDELGVSEPIVQRQGRNYIVVQLPGVQDTKRAKEILGATATLEFRAVNDQASTFEAVRRSKAPGGNELLFMRSDNRPIILSNQIIVSGENVIDASSSISQQDNAPVVSVSLDSVGGERMLEHTQKNVGKRMGVVYLESSRDADNQRIIKKSVISDAVIQGVFSSRFQISGLESPEKSRDLALLLRSGSLAAPMDIVEERTMGPTLGKQNIQRGFIALIAGMILVLAVITFRYKIFGLVANICLILNLIFIIAVLSFFQATLTLPGIAGIVLTMGMAVDANVLIFERIREQIKLGLSNVESINLGFKEAFRTIIDANITTLIAAVVLFVFGTGAIKGFALTLSIGIATSMFSAIIIGRFIIDCLYPKSTSKHKVLSI